MSSNHYPNLVQIFVNGQIKDVYNNQSVLQALLQFDENIQHCCYVAKTDPRYSNSCRCSVRIENHDRNRKFKACLALVEAGMELKTE